MSGASSGSDAHGAVADEAPLCEDRSEAIAVAGEVWSPRAAESRYFEGGHHVPRKRFKYIPFGQREFVGTLAIRPHLSCFKDTTLLNLATSFMTFTRHKCGKSGTQ